VPGASRTRGGGWRASQGDAGEVVVVDAADGPPEIDVSGFEVPDAG
jgi:hypothetical protein